MERWIVAFIGTLILAAILTPIAALAGLWAGLIAAAGCVAFTPWVSRQLPESLGNGFGHHRILSVAWTLLGVIAILQMGRLSAFMSDPSLTWGSVVPDPIAVEHQCMSAYIHAADLARRGEKNIYDERFYPAFNWKPGTGPTGINSPVRGLSRYLLDPYQYPPPFLLLPRAALALTNNYLSIRTAWFLLQSLILIFSGIFLAKWIGGREGLLAGLLIPALLTSLPTMFNLQFGQFHVMTVILAMSAMVAFERRRGSMGGALLAFAILAKIFPAVLLFYLVARRNWRAIGWTAAFGCLFSLIGLAVLGWAPFEAFLTYQLPRLMTGKAFSFMEMKGVPPFMIVRNYSIQGLMTKLSLLGLPGIIRSVVIAVTIVYGLMVLLLSWRAGKNSAVGSALRKAQVWLGLLNLAALQSPLAPSAYVLAPTLFLLCLLATEVRGRKLRGVAIVVAWLIIMGAPPLPEFPDLLTNLISQLFAFAINVWIVVRNDSAPSPVLEPAEALPDFSRTESIKHLNLLLSVQELKIASHCQFSVF
jgi:Glycosyltransferase family 87